MKKYLIIFFTSSFLYASAQEKLIFDTAKITATTKLIGRYPQYDKTKTYKDLNFIVESPEEIKRIIPTLSLNQERENAIEEPGFTISIIQDKDEKKLWSVNPAFNTASYNGHTYQFDITKLKELAKKYPFNYRFEKISFKSKVDYETYLTQQKLDSAFLFDYSPLFKYEGSFEIQFPKNEQFSSPKAISEYLSPILEKIASKNEYRVSYILNQRNLNDQTQFTMTITGSKTIYEKLQVDKLIKESWKETIEQGWFFYKVK